MARVSLCMSQACKAPSFHLDWHSSSKSQYQPLFQSRPEDKKVRLQCSLKVLTFKAKKNKSFSSSWGLRMKIRINFYFMTLGHITTDQRISKKVYLLTQLRTETQWENSIDQFAGLYQFTNGSWQGRGLFVKTLRLPGSNPKVVISPLSWTKNILSVKPPGAPVLSLQDFVPALFWEHNTLKTELSSWGK